MLILANLLLGHVAAVFDGVGFRVERSGRAFHFLSILTSQLILLLRSSSRVLHVGIGHLHALRLLLIHVGRHRRTWLLRSLDRVSWVILLLLKRVHVDCLRIWRLLQRIASLVVLVNTRVFSDAKY